MPALTPTPSPLLTLAAWLSPSYPVGAFAYSHGLERAVADGVARDRESLSAWIGFCLRHGGGWSDAVLLVHAMRGAAPDMLDDLARALAPSRERLLETEAQGRAFAETTAAAWGGDPTPRAYPVAVGLAAGARGLPEFETTALYLQAFCSNLISAGVRLIPIGQTDGQIALAGLRPRIEVVAAAAQDASLEEVGGCALAADICSMRHETQEVRLFRS